MPRYKFTYAVETEPAVEVVGWPSSLLALAEIGSGGNNGYHE